MRSVFESRCKKNGAKMACGLSSLFRSLKCAVGVRSYLRTLCAGRAVLRAADENKRNTMENLKANPYFDKYADKIAALQKTSPEEFLSRVDATFKVKKNAQSSADPFAERGFSNLAAPKPKSPPLAYRKEQTLDSVMKTDLIVNKSSEEISKIWTEYHQSQDKIAAIIPAETYAIIYKNSQEFPMFLYLLPREQGFEFIVSQFSGHECHFTSLINYQAYKENAPECLTIVHYTELLDKQGIVLMRGEYDKNVLNGIDARFLANQVQLYYTSPPEGGKHALLRRFTHDPDSFKHTDLIDELNKTSL